MGDKLGLVIPTLNEEGTLGTLLDRVRTNLERLQFDFEVIVVDDDSRDGTQQIVNQLRASDPRIRLMVRKEARGLAGAVIYGWERTDANLLGVIDADLQHPPELLPDLVNAVREGKDIAVASRYLEEDGMAGWNPVRRFISMLGTWVTIPLQRREIRVRDPLSGFFVLRRRCIEGVRLQQQGFKLLLEILVRGNIRSVTEIPYHFGVRQAGSSKADLRVGLDYLQLLGRLSRNAFSKTGHA
jgi:dolichol-phosphate mannosyltransferase